MMVRETLIIRTDKGLGDSDPAFKGIEITDYKLEKPRMGTPRLTATLMWPECLDKEWTQKEYVAIGGERYYILQTADSAKSNDDCRYKHELQFVPERDKLLGGVYFYDTVYFRSTDFSASADKPASNSTKFAFYGTVAEFADRINCALRYRGIGDSILETKTSLTTLDTPAGDGYCAMVDPCGDYDKEKSYEFAFEDKYISEALAEGFGTTGVPFAYRGKRIVIGELHAVLERKFEYGADSELLSVSKKNAGARVINSITAEGSSDNIPHYYPNETEYGHVSLAAKAGNKALSADMLRIANMTTLLSRINADQHAVLARHEAAEEGWSSAEADAYAAALGGPALGGPGYQTYAPGDRLKHEPSGAASTVPWSVRAQFNVTKAGRIRCSAVNAAVWMQGMSEPSAAGNAMASVIPVSLTRFADDDEPMGGEEKPDGWDGINEDLTAQMSKAEGAVLFGELQPGAYAFEFAISVTNEHTVFCWLDSVAFDAPRDPGKEGYKWVVGGKEYMGIGELGVEMSGDVTDGMLGDGFGWQASGRMPFQTRLAPPKYRGTKGAERFYNALNAPYEEEYASEHQGAYADPDTGQPYEFPNPYAEGSPSEYIYKNEDIMPTIEGVRNNVQKTDADGQPLTDAAGNPVYQLLGEIAAVSYDPDDNDALKAGSSDSDKNDALKYEHSFFYVKLNKFSGEHGFDLFSRASQSGAMTIQMRSGSCNGCKFKIQAAKMTSADGLEYYANPVVVKDGRAVGVVSEEGISESDLDASQQDTRQAAVWICLQKDAETFGVIMPNKGGGFKPAPGDTFSIINIDLPQPYILAAEKRLEEEAMRFMADSNEEKFTFDISASRIFFAEHPEVLAQLDEYSKIIVKYDGREYEQYVSAVSIECRDGEALPDIGITLADTIAAGETFAQRVAERALSLIATPYTLGAAPPSPSGGLSASLADSRYVSKMRADRSPYSIASGEGFEVGDFLAGSRGGVFYRDPETGQTYIEADKIRARMKAIFAELEVAKERSIGGKFDITPGGGIDISFVEELEDSYRCYFKAKDEDKGADCRFAVGDQARCQESNIASGTAKAASNRYYWRLVTAVNNEESYVELSKGDCDDGSDAPMEGDTIVQLGSRNAERRSAIVLSTVDASAPSVTLYDGIGAGDTKAEWYSLESKAVVEYGVDKSKTPPEPFFRCYGSMFIGPRSKESYLEYVPSEKRLEYKGVLHIDSTIGDKTIENYVKSVVPLNEYDYLKQALWQDTTIAGGLILASAVSLGYDGADGARHTTAGMNGMSTQPKAIASWWGGPMADRYYTAGGAERDEPANGAASALVRMDGTGYFAGGNIQWDEDGGGSVAQGNIRWNALGAVTIASGVTINLANNETLASTMETILSFINGMNGLFQVIDSQRQPHSITWAAANTGEVFAVKALKGLYSDSFISALGASGDGGGGGGGGSAASLMREWDSAQDGNAGTEYALGANLGWELKNAFSGYLTTTAAASLYQPKGDYLTEHQPLKTLTLQKNGETVGTFTPSTAKTLNLQDVASAAALAQHVSSTTMHTTSAEKSLWNEGVSIATGAADDIAELQGRLAAAQQRITELTAQVAALASAVDGCVKKAGDTMTGALTVQGAIAADSLTAMNATINNEGKFMNITAYGWAKVSGDVTCANLDSKGRVNALTQS